MPARQIRNVLPLVGIVGRGLADDRPVLHAPELRIAVPAAEVLAVEDRLEAGFTFLRGAKSAGSVDENRQQDGQKSEARSRSSHDEASKREWSETAEFGQRNHAPCRWRMQGFARLTGLPVTTKMREPVT